MADKGCVAKVGVADGDNFRQQSRARAGRGYRPTTLRRLCTREGFLLPTRPRPPSSEQAILQRRPNFPAGDFRPYMASLFECVFRGEPRAGRDDCPAFSFEEAEAQGRVAENSVAHRLIGIVLSAYCGDLARRREESSSWRCQQGHRSSDDRRGNRQVWTRHWCRWQTTYLAPLCRGFMGRLSPRAPMHQRGDAPQRASWIIFQPASLRLGTE